MNRAYHPVLHEIRDQQGNWVTGWCKFSDLADLIGTTTADLMRRLSMLGIAEYREGRHRLTPLARQKLHGTTLHGIDEDSGRHFTLDVILPDGMVHLVQNLEATNAPPSETERLIGEGLARKEVARRLNISPKAVRKRLAAIPPQLKDWPVLGRWQDEEGNDDADNDNNADPRRNWPKHWLEREALWEMGFGEDHPAWPKPPTEDAQSLVA